MKRGALMKKRGVIILCIILIISVLAAAFDARLKTVTYTIKSAKIIGEVKLAIVTDLHSCYYGKNQNKLLDEIEKQHADVVLLGGDVFDDVLDDTNARVFVEGVTQKYKTYYVSGNHEWWSGRMYDMFEYLASAGVTVLRGNSDKLQIGEDTIAIYGIDDPEINTYDDTYLTWEEQLEQVGKSIEENRFNLLLTHRPEYVEKYFEYDFDGKKLIVSRGLARESTRLPRIFNSPELVFVNLVPQE